MIGYFYGNNDFEYIQENKSDIILVFVHGIFSNTKNAFRLKDGTYFWDLLKKNELFAMFDFAMYSYKLINITTIFTWEFPMNNLEKISEDLNVYLKDYKNVLFIAHSQGGLLAKTYATSYYKSQGIHLMTLHTPHKNNSLAVLKFKKSQEWDENVSYIVPHIFAGCSSDIIVNPISTNYSVRDKNYFSKRKEKKDIKGHSNLNTNPDPELLEIYKKDIFYFNFSGVSKLFVNEYQKKIGCGDKEINITFARIKQDLSEGLEIHSPITDFLKFYNTLEEEKNQVKIGVIACSINHILKQIELYKKKNIKITWENISNVEENNFISNSKMCCWLFAKENYSNDNLYKYLPFDINDFRKNSLIDNEYFLKIFLELLEKENFNIADYYEEDNANEYKTKLSYFYSKAREKYKKEMLYNVYEECLLNTGFENFLKIVTSIIKAILDLKEHKNSYEEICVIIKKEFFEKNISIGLLVVETIVAKLMRSDGELYWVDKHIKNMFNKESPIVF